MEMIDKYIYAIGQKLPLKSRAEIKKELTSLILDEIEGKYGENPTVAQQEEAIISFGTPNKVAKRYSGATLVIGEGFTDLYFMICKIMVGAMSIAFVTVFIVSLFTENIAGLDILKGFLKVPFRVLQASFSGIGVVTLIFIVISKLMKNGEVDLEDDWGVKELESIELTEKVESKIEAIVSIIFLSVFIALINIYPEFITFLEDSYEKSGLVLGNRVDMNVFSSYIIVFSILGILQIINQVLILKKEMKTRAIYIFETFISLFDLLFTIAILKIGTLFIYNGIDQGIFTTSTIGFKIFLIIGLITGSFELIGKVVNYIKMEFNNRNKI
ncbi:MAG: hypothetical protein OCD02_19810 [Spirochaetaceae bacterium]